MNLTSLTQFLYHTAMLITPRAIAKMAKMTIFAIMATIVMANGTFSMAINKIHFATAKWEPS